MSAVATTSIAEAYSEKFDNYAELAHPEIFFLPKFGDLLQKAIDRNSPLTEAEVKEEFGGLAWDW